MPRRVVLDDDDDDDDDEYAASEHEPGAWNFFHAPSSLSSEGDAMLSSVPEDLLCELGFDRVVAGMTPDGACTRTDDAVASLLEFVEAGADSPIDDEAVRAFKRTGDALPALLAIMRAVEPYETEHGTVNPDHGLALFAWHVSHHCSMTQCTGKASRAQTCSCFFLSPQLDGLLRDSANGSVIDQEKLVSLAAAFDCDPSQAVAESATSSMNGSTAFLRVMYKRATEHPPGNPNRLLLAEEGATDPTCADTNNPLCLISLLRGSIDFLDDADGKRAFHMIRSDLGCPDLFCDFGTRESSQRHYAKPGQVAILPTSTHHFDDSSRLALQRLQSRPLPFGDFCKFMLFVLTDGMGSSNDYRRLYTNAHRAVHTGMWLCFASWLMFNADELMARLDSVRTTHIDFLGDDVLHELLVRHMVVPMHNPRLRQFTVKREARERYGEEACKAMETYSPHEGQKVTLQTLQIGDFECHSKFLSHTRESANSPDAWMTVDTRYQTAAAREERMRIASNMLELLHHPPPIDNPDALMRPFCESQEASADAHDFVFGMRYRTLWVRVTNRQIGCMRLVCKAWDDLLKPFCLRPAFGNFVEDYSETAADVRDSSALHGMAPLNVHLLERSAWSSIYVARRYAHVDSNGDLAFKVQSFPPNLFCIKHLHVTLRLAAVDGDTARSRSTAYVHVPLINTKAKYMIGGNPNNRLVHRTVPDQMQGRLLYRFTESQHRWPTIHEPIVSGMFLVDKRAMLHSKWMPATTSLSFRKVTGMPLTPLRMFAYIGEECGGKDHVAVSSPFYVLSRKARQSAVDEAARKRRKVVQQLDSVAEERELDGA